MHASQPHPRDERGFALITSTVMLGILLAFSWVLLTSSINTRMVGKSFQQSLAAEQVAEAGLHKALYCIKATSGTNCGGTYGASYTGESNVAIGDARFTTIVTGSGSTRTVTSIGTSVTGQSRTVSSNITSLPDTTAMTMAAAVQAGAGGITMANNVSVNGDGDNDNSVSDSDVVSEGDITCSNNAKISGNVSVTRAGGKVHNCTVTKNAYANILTNNKISLNAYYRNNPADISGSTVSGTKYANSATPSPVAMPNLDIDAWKAVAEAGGVTTGNITLSNNGSITLGPRKITGNLNMANNSTLTLTGTVWVVGNINFANNAVIKLHSSYGAASGMLISDGRIHISNNGNVQGSGTAGSVTILVSTNDSNNSNQPAIHAANNVSGAVMYAPNGLVRTSNNADVPAVIGARVVMDNNTTVNKNGLNIFGAPVNIAESGSGTGWHIQDDTWREFK